jgi:23S rRNA (adenine2503-C2)-methyltransferase
MALDNQAPEHANLTPLTMDNIKDLTLEQLGAWLKDHGEAPYRARQIFQWLYQRGVRDFAEMSNIAKGLRTLLAASFHLGLLEEEHHWDSVDGSRKFAFRLADGKSIETVLMPNNEQHTLCVSTQVGCAMGCDFCMTARMGLIRNLTPGEIVQQVVEAARHVHEGRFIRNVVFMGMGEPLHNYDNLARALRILTEDMGFGFSKRRLTVSTSGLVPAIRRFGQDALPANLAVSLNGTTDAVRERLMPVNRRWNIAALMDACREFPADNRVRITFEYILIKGVTDDMADAKRLVKLLHGIKAKVNLIPYNAGEDSPYQSPGLEHARAFQEALLARGVLATLRISKGQDIRAACGQLVRQTGGAENAAVQTAGA